MTVASSHEHFTAPTPEMEKLISEKIAQMTVEEKITILGGDREHGATQACERLGIPAAKMSDGPMGVHWWCDQSTAYPATVGAAATWDPGLVEKLGGALGRDCRARGVHILLAPGVNIYRSPECGRNFEYFGEDPHLASQMAVAFIKGVQAQGVCATVKHYALNFQEYDRHGVSSDVDERTFREIYLPTFEAAVKQAGVGSVMTAYNLVNGVHCSQHEKLITDILKREWGFDGLVMSDWVSTYDGVASANAGLDLEMPSAVSMTEETLVPALDDGRVAMDTIDDKVRRILRLQHMFGWYTYRFHDTSIPENDPSSAQIALDVSRESVVMVRNVEKTLPLAPDSPKKLAVVGPFAHPATWAGGGSSFTKPFHAVSVLDGVKAIADDSVEVVHDPGHHPSGEWSLFGECPFETSSGEKGLAAEYFNNASLQGEPTVSRIDPNVNFDWGGGAIPADEITEKNWSARWTGSVVARDDGKHHFHVYGADGDYRLWVNDVLVIDVWETGLGGTQRGEIDLKRGEHSSLRLEWRKTRPAASLRIAWNSQGESRRETERAVESVRGADAAIVCVGFNNSTEGEGMDRPFAMDAESEYLVREVARVCSKTIVVLTCGGAVDMARWVDEVGAVLIAWYPGQEGGTAIAETIFGKNNPSGKLPYSIERKEQDRSSFNCYHDDDGDKRVAIADGLFCGYRHYDHTGIEPLVPFGFGLSYTSFALEHLSVSASNIKTGEGLSLTVDVVNTGKRAGAEVVQVYVSDPESSLPRPPKELKGFSKIWCTPGETKRTKVQLDPRAFSFYDSSRSAWVTEPGQFEILVGTSSRGIVLRASVTVSQ